MEKIIRMKKVFELPFGKETLVIPDDPRCELIRMTGEKTLRDSAIECYCCATRESMKKEAGAYPESVSTNDIEIRIEKDLKEKGNQYVLDQMYEWGHYCLAKDGLSLADSLYYFDKK